MEALTEGDDLVASTIRRAPLARKLERRLVRLGARVREEHLAVEAGQLNELVRQNRRRRIHEEVRAMTKRRGLVLNRLDDLLVAVADGVDADAAGEIVIAHAVRIAHGDSLTTGDDH